MHYCIGINSIILYLHNTDNNYFHILDKPLNTHFLWRFKQFINLNIEKPNLQLI